MPHEVPAVLTGLADLYRKSSAGSREGGRDFTCDHELVLRHAGCHDGDEREKAEDDLKRAELESGGLFSMDRERRTGLLLRVRLSRDGGETWLFQRIGQTPPREQRSGLASFFKAMAEETVPEDWRENWRAWCELLEVRALERESVQPFKREDTEGNADFLNALLGVIRWQDESLIRFASSVICGDSKRLETLETRLIAALQAISGNDEMTLEDRGILRKPRMLAFHGPLRLKFAHGWVDFSPLPGPSRISETNLIQAEEVLTTASQCLTVENEEVFLELSKRNPGWLLVLTSFPGSAVRRLFRRLRMDLKCFHFGDSDPAGFDILRDLREKTGRSFNAICMDFRQIPEAPCLTDAERKSIERLLAMPLMSDVHDALRRMLEDGSKGNFEQESVPLQRVIDGIGHASSDGDDFSD